MGATFALYGWRILATRALPLWWTEAGEGAQENLPSKNKVPMLN